MNAISEIFKNVYAVPFEKTGFGGRFNSCTSVYVGTCISMWEADLQKYNCTINGIT